MIEEEFPQKLDTDGLAHRLEDTFRDEGYKVQEIGSGDDIAVQIKKGTTKKALVGMDQAITVRMQRQGNQTTVSVGQAKWADKVGVEVIGAMVFWPLMIPATYGVYEQHTLPKRVVDAVNEFASATGANPSNSKESLMVDCSNCGVINSADTETCSACGRPLI